MKIFSIGPVHTQTACARLSQTATQALGLLLMLVLTSSHLFKEPLGYLFLMS